MPQAVTRSLVLNLSWGCLNDQNPIFHQGLILRTLHKVLLHSQSETAHVPTSPRLVDVRYRVPHASAGDSTELCFRFSLAASVRKGQWRVGFWLSSDAGMFSEVENIKTP